MKKVDSISCLECNISYYGRTFLSSEDFFILDFFDCVAWTQIF